MGVSPKLAVVEELGSKENGFPGEIATASWSTILQEKRLQQRLEVLRGLGPVDLRLEELQSHPLAPSLLKNLVHKLMAGSELFTGEVGLSEVEVASCLFESPFLGGSAGVASKHSYDRGRNAVHCNALARTWGM